MKVERRGDCLIWLGSYYVSRSGAHYPRLGKTYLHRLMYEIHVGPIPEGFEVDHVVERGCVSTMCVNYEHLEALTPGENQARSSRHPIRPPVEVEGTCRKGHPYSAIDKRGTRICGTCEAARQRELRARRRAAKAATQRSDQSLDMDVGR